MIRRRDHLRWLAIGRCVRRPIRTASAPVTAFLDLRFGLKPGKIFGHGTLLTLRIGPVQLARRFAAIAAGVGFHHARIHREPFAFDKSHIHARFDDRLEQSPEHIAFAEATVMVDR